MLEQTNSLCGSGLFLAGVVWTISHYDNSSFREFACAVMVLNKAVVHVKELPSRSISVGRQ